MNIGDSAKLLPFRRPHLTRFTEKIMNFTDYGAKTNAANGL